MFYIFFAWLTFITACNKDVDIVPESKPKLALEDFSFLRQHNPGLTEHFILSLDSNRYYGVAPEEARIKDLIASFEIDEGSIVFVDGKVQESGVTSNNFKNIVEYKVQKSDGQVVEFIIDIQSIPDFPVVYIETENHAAVTSKEEYINARIHIDGQDFFEDLLPTDIRIRGRGNSTWYLHPKKPYQIKFEDKYKMLEMPKDRRWLFLAEYSDKTFLRNRIAFELGYLSNLEWTPESEFAELYFNNEFQGLYHITQKVEESSNRVNIEENGYLLEIDQLDRIDPDDVYFYSDHFLLNIKEPEIEKNSAEYTYIKQFIRDFETALFGPAFKNPSTGYRKYIDVESMVDWFLINEIAKNVDARSFASIFMYMNPGEKLKMGPIWDFDLGFGNVNYADPEFPTEFWVRYNPWIDRMLDDPFFVALVKERMNFFKSQEGRIYELIDRYANELAYQIEENDKVWNTIGNWVWPNPKVFNTYELEVHYLKEWYGTRMAWLSLEIENL